MKRSTKMNRSTPEKSYKDPVCGMKVSHTSAIATSTYEGKTYYFCADACKHAFNAMPQKYVQQHRQHGMISR